MSNLYEEKYIYKLANKSDIDAIMKYIGEEWRTGHILAQNKKLFMWQYGNSEYGDDKNINFVLMCDIRDNRILGLNGFIRYSDDPDNMYISSALTNVSKGTLPMSGIELIRQFHKLVPAKGYFSSGTNPKTMIPIGKKVFKFRIGVMQQYYILNTDFDEYRVAYIEEKPKELYESGEYELVSVNDFSELTARFELESEFENLPYKSGKFIKKRYFDHPYYRYRVWLVKKRNSDENAGVIFGREIDVKDRKILRFVDFRGDIACLSGVGETVHELIRREKYEYADLLVSQLPEEMMKKSGFTLLDTDGKNIIPHYFEPFEHRNIKNHFQESSDIIIFKADGDQDRPSIV